jgi:predicted small metal-binding protein
MMARKYIDCRENPETSQICSVAISADSEDEVIEAAARHAEEVHGYEDTPELRGQLKSSIREGSPCP